MRMNALRFLIGTTRARCLALASSLAWASLAGCADTSPECPDLLAQAHERAETGNLDAQFKGQMYEHGECVAVDMQAAAKWYRQAADSGHAGAQKVLGFMYAGGVGLEEDTKQAVYWFRKAAEQGHPEAQVGLGIAYLRGIGVPQDLDEATRWLRRSAEQGFARGQFNLGHSYETGQGVPQDYVQAYMWYKLAADRYPKADRALKRLARNNDAAGGRKRKPLSQRLERSSGRLTTSPRC